MKLEKRTKLFGTEVVPSVITTAINTVSEQNRLTQTRQLFLICFISLATLLLSACGSTSLETLPTEAQSQEEIQQESASPPVIDVPAPSSIKLPNISSFNSSDYYVVAPQKIRLNFSTNEAVDELELHYNSQKINVTGQTSVDIDIIQSTTFNLHAYNATSKDIQSTSLSVRVGNTPFILQEFDVLRLRATDGNRQLKLGTTVPEGYELVVMGIGNIGDSKTQTLKVIEQRGLKADTASTALTTQALPNTSIDTNIDTYLPIKNTALLLEDNLSTRSDLSSGLAQDSLQTQAIQSCSYTVGSICSFFVLAFDKKINVTFLDKRDFKLVSSTEGINFFVDIADLVSPNPDIEPINKASLEHLGGCANAVFKRHFNQNFASKTDIDGSGGVSFLLSNVLPYNGMVRWDDVNRATTSENNRADVAYLNTEHMRGLSPLGLATMYEEMFHAYHLGYRAATGLGRPDRFEAESVVGAVLNNIREDKGISSMCGGSAKDSAQSIEIASGHFTLANIFLNRSYKRSLFSNDAVSLQMAQYGIGRLLSSTINYRDSNFIDKVITSQHKHHKTWQTLTDSTRVFEDAWLSLFLADSTKHSGYTLNKNHYTRLDTNYNILGNIKGLSLNTLNENQAQGQSNDSLILLTGQAAQNTQVVNLNLDFDSGSVVAFLRLKN